MKIKIVLIVAAALAANAQPGETLKPEDQVKLAIAQRNLAAAQGALMSSPAYKSLQQAQDAYNEIRAAVSTQCSGSGKTLDENVLKCVEVPAAKPSTESGPKSGPIPPAPKPSTPPPTKKE